MAKRASAKSAVNTHKRVSGPLKWHGGKYYLAPAIAEMCHRLPHKHYVEPYAGGLSVLLARNPHGYSEVINDTNKSLMNFWRVLVERSAFEELQRRLTLTPFSEAIWAEAAQFLQKPPPATTQEDRVLWAMYFFICCRQSLAGRLRRPSFSPVSRRRLRGGINEQVSAWLSAVENLAPVHLRLQQVLRLCRPALKVIESQDGPDTLFYLDPTYLPETRVTTEAYEDEMSYEDHEELLKKLAKLKGIFLLSGYRSPLYDQWSEQQGWHRVEFDLPNNASQSKAKERRIECVWANRPISIPTDLLPVAEV